MTGIFCHVISFRRLFLPIPVYSDGSFTVRAVSYTHLDSYITAWGPNEYTTIGNLSNYEYRDKLKNIKEPALIINGTNDLCTPLVAKTMYDSIPNSRWELFDDCRHACFVEDTDRYCRLLNEWMEQND